MNTSLTPTQEKVLAFLREFFAANDQLPPIKIINQHFGWASSNTAMNHLHHLFAKRIIEKNAANRYRFARS